MKQNSQMKLSKYFASSGSPGMENCSVSSLNTVVETDVTDAPDMDVALECLEDLGARGSTTRFVASVLAGARLGADALLSSACSALSLLSVALVGSIVSTRESLSWRARQYLKYCRLRIFASAIRRMKASDSAVPRLLRSGKASRTNAASNWIGSDSTFRASWRRVLIESLLMRAEALNRLSRLALIAAISCCSSLMEPPP